jgi:aspartate/methionine/tyrosine aminotransferase
VVYNRDEIKAIGEWCVANGIWVVADEIYEHLTFGDHQSNSLPVVVPEAANTTLVINGVAKTYAMTGWRVGWLIGPVDAIKAAGNRHSHNASNVSNVSQRAAIAAVAGDLSAVAEMREAFDRRRTLIYELINNAPGMSCLEPEGAFYAFANVKDVIGRTLRGREITSSLDFVEVLLDEIKVAVVPGEAFGSSGYLRFSYALGDADIAEGLERITALLKE